MGEPRTVVITGASRGLGFASTVRLYREGWRVVAAMRTPDRGMPLLRQVTGAAEGDDRLIGVALDLLMPRRSRPLRKQSRKPSVRPRRRPQRRHLRGGNGGGS